jgi:voltage-gated potassium channel
LDDYLDRRVIGHLISLLALVLIGTLGYMWVENWRLLDAAYMTVLTLATVGYQEVHPLSDAGRVYTIVFIMTGVGLALYILNDMVHIIIESNPGAGRRMKHRIAKLSDHQVVCGFGRTGQEVVSHFLTEGVPLVVIESDENGIKRAQDQGLMVVEGDATDDEILVAAGVERAKGIVCTLPDDAANTFIALTAKGLNEGITIVARAANPGSEGKLRRAGASMVISPYVICGRRMATAVTHPLITEFLEVIMHTPGYDLRMEHIHLTPRSAFVGQTLKDANIKQTAGVMILAINRGGKLISNPDPDLAFQAGDDLIGLGTQEQLKKLADLASAQEH